MGTGSPSFPVEQQPEKEPLVHRFVSLFSSIISAWFPRVIGPTTASRACTSVKGGGCPERSNLAAPQKDNDELEFDAMVLEDMDPEDRREFDQVKQAIDNKKARVRQEEWRMVKQAMTTAKGKKRQLQLTTKPRGRGKERRLPKQQAPK